MKNNLSFILLMFLSLLAWGADAARKPAEGQSGPVDAAGKAVVVAQPVSGSSLLLPHMAVSQWEKANGLTTFWDKDAFRGRVARLDSRVEAKQAMEWEALLRKQPAAVVRPPQPKYASAPFYSAIGGDHGVLLDSVLFKVEPGQNYRLTAEVKGTAGAYVWIKGFRRHPKRNMLLDSYQTRLDAAKPSAEEWRTISIGFNPTAKSPATEYMKVRLYAFWPVGVVYFANVSLEKITPEEMAELVQARQDVKTTDK